ncbi:NAD-dependent DNA ligase LigA [Clostridium sp.]|uniref:NAD-dependent DNA ligase LigA n=1 Tax=Clostridium sp. TaxID=1506 RepID=UPI002FDE6D41
MYIKEKIEQLRKIIEYHNDKYYNQDDPEITDYEYDKLYVELKNLEDSYPEYKIQSSPTEKIGGTVKRELRKVKHDIPVVSLQDVFSKEEVYSFVEKIKSEITCPKFVVEKKIDGLTVVLRYYNGELKEAITRGDGSIGESVFENILQVESIPKRIPSKLNYLEVRGEIYMTNENFIKVNEKQEETGGKIFKNPRNLAAGTIRQLDTSIVRERSLNIFIFNLEISEGKKFETHSETLKWLSTQGFDVSPDFKICKTAEEVWNAILDIGKSRWDLGYSIDGAVVKVDSLSDRISLGMTSKVPKWTVAFKYPPEQKETVIENIIVQVSRTGRLNPLALLRPVTLANTTVSKATLHNQDFIDSKDIRIGDTVVIQKAGDIIPEIIRSIPEKRPDWAKKYTIPDVCPVCNSKTIKEPDGVDTRCSNPDCEAQSFRKIGYFVSKDAMNITGFGQNTVEALMKDGYIKKISDIYTLKNYKDELIEKGIIGKEKSVNNLLNAIETSKDNDIDRLITGLGIRNVGKQSAKILAANFNSMDDIAGTTYEQLIELEDFGPTTVPDILEFFTSDAYRELIKKLKETGVNTLSKTSQKKVDNRFSGKTFVITGTLPTMKREEAAEIIQSFGGKVSGSVSKKTSFVLAGEEAGSKLTKAQQLDIPIITEEDLKNMMI